MSGAVHPPQLMDLLLLLFFGFFGAEESPVSVGEEMFPRLFDTEELDLLLLTTVGDPLNSTGGLSGLFLGVTSSSKVKLLLASQLLALSLNSTSVSLSANSSFSSQKIRDVNEVAIHSKSFEIEDLFAAFLFDFDSLDLCS